MTSFPQCPEYTIIPFEYFIFYWETKVRDVTWRWPLLREVARRQCTFRNNVFTILQLRTRVLTHNCHCFPSSWHKYFSQQKNWSLLIDRLKRYRTKLLSWKLNGKLLFDIILKNPFYFIIVKTVVSCKNTHSFPTKRVLSLFNPFVGLSV